MKKILFIAIILLSFVFGKVYAEEVVTPTPPDPVNIHLTITTNTGSMYDQDMNVIACDSDNPSVLILKVTMYCAILQSGFSSDWNFTWAPGIFLNSLNNIAGFTTKDNDGNDVYHYWSWSLNGTEAQVGLNQYELQANDSISLTFIDPVPQPPIPEIIPVPTSSHSSGSIILKKIKPTFNTKKAFEFLISQQKENGSFGQDLYTDWTALALGTTSDYQIEKNKLIKYLGEIKTADYQLTDYERHAMASMALGLNPYGVSTKNLAMDGMNYIKKITDSFDGKQFGDKEQDNDDIFALIVLQNAGYKENEDIIKNTINFIISKQKENGSWDNNVDMTGAGMQAIMNIAEKNCFPLGSLSGLANPALTLGSSACESPQNKEFLLAMNKAKEFLKQNQKGDGGFGNVSSTAWAMEGILALGEKPEDWKVGENTPLDYLAINQETEGNMRGDNIESKIWQTAYALSALSGKTWNQIMQKFDKPVFVEQAQVKTTTQIVKKISQKPKAIRNISKELTASPINAISEVQTSEPVKTQSWFRRLINKIFGL